MDVVLNYFDNVLFDRIYPETFNSEDGVRQLISLTVLSTFFGYLTYFLFAAINYWLIYDKELLTDKLALKNQVRLEMAMACKSLPIMAFFSALSFWLEVRGYSRLHSDPVETIQGLVYLILSTLWFISFTDACIYWIHRWLHLPVFYSWLHKDHHKWKITTPWASHAFHPIDGFVQSLPYHLYVFLFPMHKIHHLIVFGIVNIWTISIHDGDFRVAFILRPLINGSAHHADHHRYYKVNYGQYFTLWDRLGGTFRNPDGYTDSERKKQ